MSALVTVSSPTRPQSRVVEGLRGQQGALPPGKGLLAPWLGHPRLQLRPDIRGRPVETCGLVQDRVQWPSSPGSILPAGWWASRNWLVLPPIPVGGGGQWGLRQDSPRPATMEAGTWAPHLRPGTGQPRQPLTSTWGRPAPPPPAPQFHPDSSGARPHVRPPLLAGSGCSDAPSTGCDPSQAEGSGDFSRARGVGRKWPGPHTARETCPRGRHLQALMRPEHWRGAGTHGRGAGTHGTLQEPGPARLNPSLKLSLASINLFLPFEN